MVNPPHPGDFIRTQIIKGHGLTDPDFERRVWVMANGILINEWVFTRSEGPMETEALIPREVARDDFLHLVFRIDRPRALSALRISDDPRALGLAFVRLRCSEASVNGSTNADRD